MHSYATKPRRIAPPSSINYERINAKRNAEDRRAVAARISEVARWATEIGGPRNEALATAERLVP